MTRLSFPDVCARLKTHFLPYGFEGALDSAHSMTVRVFDPATGENLAVIAGLPGGVSLSPDELAVVIGAIEAEVEMNEVRRGGEQVGERVVW